MPRSQIEADPLATRRRITRLRKYVERTLLTDEQRFVCEWHRECKSSVPGYEFRPGTMSHIGRHYDLYRGDRPLRIMVVGQESGLARGKGAGERNARVSLEERYRIIHDGSGLSRGYYAEGGRKGRNTHMRGVTQALRLAFDLGIGGEHDDEYVDTISGARFHIFDGFALVNRLLCSAGTVGTSTERSSPTMRENCGSHFRVQLELLDPTLVILQGEGVRKWSAELLPERQRYSDTLYATEIGSARALVCAFSHPSARGELRWGDRLDAPYLKNVVAPTIRRALRRL